MRTGGYCLPIRREPNVARGAATMSGRRAKSIRGGRGEPGFRSSRDGLERWSKGGGEKGQGTEPCIRRPTPVLLRVVFVPAECRASPPFIFWSGRACSVHRAFFSSAPRPALARRAFPHPSPLPAPSSPAFSTSAPVPSRGRDSKAASGGRLGPALIPEQPFLHDPRS